MGAATGGGGGEVPKKQTDIKNDTRSSRGARWGHLLGERAKKGGEGPETTAPKGLSTYAKDSKECPPHQGEYTKGKNDNGGTGNFRREKGVNKLGWGGAQNFPGGKKKQAQVFWWGGGGVGGQEGLSYAVQTSKFGEGNVEKKRGNTYSPRRKAQIVKEAPVPAYSDELMKPRDDTDSSQTPHSIGK